ncbi:hypothetical protein B0I32_11427 [Nonomuraea fuscirosea]|uniref:Uncharacterized protein n=1 Tax=Nonomuraea fuscirosea TaxID=1291556 RepID=A0A2T0MSS6_9ACTN|nr:hypothetical protein [Nonomuraea fuscirosea]PRX61658.1 hypothetical protein B0I32_11427 [Nonomuraea fuscirosea]
MNEPHFRDRGARHLFADISTTLRENPADARSSPARDGKEASWNLPAVPEAAAVACRLVREALAVWGLSALADDLTVVVSEVVTGAIGTRSAR